jgi:hypothetical protein
MRFFRNGREITEQEARDEQGLLRDGCSARVAMTGRDSGSRLRLTDGNGDAGLALQRPGFRRLRDDSFGDAVKREANLEYKNRVSNAWRNVDAAAEEEDDDEIATAPLPHEDHRTVAQCMADHEAIMDRVYQEYAQEQSNAWRGGK